MDSTTADPQAPPSPTSRRRRIVVLAAGAAVVLVGAAFAVVHVIDAAALAQTRVFLDSRSLTCKNPADVTTITRGEPADSNDQTYAVPAVRGSADLDCRLSVVVENNSDRTLDIDRVTFTLLGPDSAVGLHSDYTFTQGLHPYPRSDRTNVVYDYVNDPENHAPFPVTAGSTHRFDFHLTSDGCRQADASTTWPDSPTFTATIGTTTQDLPLDGAGFGFIGAKTNKQPCT